MGEDPPTDETTPATQAEGPVDVGVDVGVGVDVDVDVDVNPTLTASEGDRALATPTEDLPAPGPRRVGLGRRDTFTDPAQLEDEVQRLLKAGEHAAAAAALRHHGQPVRAAAIYERLFEHKAALAAYEAGDDITSAVRVAISLGDGDAIERLVRRAIATDQGDVLVTALQKAGRHREVGRVYEARGEPLLAARAYQAAGDLSAAARMHENLGQMREAGLLLEQHLEQHGDAGDPESHTVALRLGRILARFGRHDDAITLLQRAVRHAGAERDALRCRAAPTMALTFLALGYEDAAADVVAGWQKAWRTLKASHSPEAFEALLETAAFSGVEAPPGDLAELRSSARAAAFSAVQTTTARPSTTPPRPTSQPPRPRDDFDALFGDNAPGDTPKTNPQGGADLTRDDDDVVADADADQQLLLGGRYLLGEPLGGGGVGQVFRAHDAFADRAVAVKIFGAQALQSDAVSAWAREVRAAAALGHPALVELVELNMAQGFVVTALCGGGDHEAQLLEERLQRGSDAGWLVPAFHQLLDVLAAVHRTGLVHGGLKPSNVFLVPGGVKLLDVGAHRLLSLRATETGGLASVWPYLSPELLFGAPASVDGDLYALAAMCYRALSGRPPFAAASDDRRQPPPPIRTHNPDVPAAWETFLQRALDPDPARRFQSAEAFRAALPAGLDARLQTLPPARAVGAVRVKEEDDVAPAEERYVRGALRERQVVHATLSGDKEPRTATCTVKCYEAWDALVNRAVWILEVDVAIASDTNNGAGAPGGDTQNDTLNDTPDEAQELDRLRDERLRAYVAAARLWRGVQPVYDVIARDGHLRAVVIARNPGGLVAATRQQLAEANGEAVVDDDALERAYFAALRRVPQGLTRDLSACAQALQQLHQDGVALGGFDVARAMGPVGPRLRLAPAALLCPATDETIARDWKSFSDLVETAFDAIPDETLDTRGRLLSALHNGHLLERHDLESLARHRDDPWPVFLPVITDLLVRGAMPRAVARLIADVVRGRDR